MKYLIASDIHGNVIYFNQLLDAIKLEKPEKIFLLGDIYPYGNNFVSINEIADKLNSLDNVRSVVGNCDYTDEIFNFEFELDIKLTINNKLFFLTHGNRYNKKYPPKEFDVLVYGHEHEGYIIKEDNKLFVNSGSVSIPRNGSERGYLVITDEEIILKSLEGKVLDFIKYI